ncbi:lytic transglycosylase domain-containing protein [Dongia deserti]|uniref:lytic transglycosylase domain-containing protein n=1 Tax=Dongia deserti TaxID=2268030 RepID=UPI000E64FC90
MALYRTGLVRTGLAACPSCLTSCSRDHLFDPCTNISVGVWILRQEINQHGATWKAIGRYNFKTPIQARLHGSKVFAMWKRLNK